MSLFADEGVTSDSPAETTVNDGASSAGTLNAETAAPPTTTEHTVPYHRFAQINDGYRQAAAEAAAARAQAQQLQSQLQEYQRREQQRDQLTQRVNQTSRTPEEEAQRQHALRLLRDLQADDPDYQRNQMFLKAGPDLARGFMTLQQQVQQMQAWQQEQQAARAQEFAQSEEGRLRQLAQQGGLGQLSDQQFNVLNTITAAVVRSSPAAEQAFLRGDRSVLPAAFEIAKQQYLANDRAQRVALANTKTQTAGLPPRQGGSAPGAAASRPKFDPANPDAIERQVFAGARNFLQSREA